MSKLDIVQIPAPVLREKAAAVERVDGDVLRLMGDMLETMYAAPGIGLAAPQVNVPRKIVVIDTARNDEPKAPLFMINPEIVSVGDDMRVYEEGCLSIPEIYAEVERPAAVVVRFIDQNGKETEISAEGLLATVIQHEIDHLNGTLFIDHLSRLKRDLLIKKFYKMRREKSETV